MVDELTYAIIGCAMRVHRELGNGFPEIIYQRCLAIEMNDAGLKYQQEYETTIFYKGNQVGKRRADFIVENRVVIETKARINLDDGDLAQAKNYTVAYNLPLGLLLNFGSPSLQYKLVFNNRLNQSK